MMRWRRRRWAECALLAALVLVLVGAGASDDALQPEPMYPASVTGMWKGLWRAPNTTTNGTLAFPTGRAGHAMFALESVETAEGGVFDITGVLVLRDGYSRATADPPADVYLRVDGVYLEQSGRLHLLADSGDLTEPLPPTAAAANGAEYRAALRSAAVAEWARGAPPSAALPDRLREKGHRARVANAAAVAAAGRLLGPRRSSSRVPGPWPVASPLSPKSGDWGSGRERQWCDMRLDARLGEMPHPGGPRPPPARTVLMSFDGPPKGTPPPAWLEPWMAFAPAEVVTATLSSPTCALNLELTAVAVRLGPYLTKARWYSLGACVAAIVKLGAAVAQLAWCAAPTAAARVSPLGLGWAVVGDALCCLAHLVGALASDDLFYPLGTVALLEFALFSALGLRTLLHVYRASQPSPTDPWAALRREVEVVYTRFYAATLGATVAAHALGDHGSLLLFVLASSWVPQIVHSAVVDAREAVSPTSAALLSLARLYAPLYFWGCPRNFLYLRTNAAVCWGLVAWVTLQVLVVLVQHYHGPRAGLPANWFPPKFSYHRPLPAPGVVSVVVQGTGGEGGAVDVDDAPTCAVCMAPIEPGGPLEGHMLTPCLHPFHTPCLTRWLEVRLECPTCRRAIPPP